VPNEALEISLEIYNDTLRARLFPHDWKEYRIFSIPKKNKRTV
jgi:hypothetical protein